MIESFTQNGLKWAVRIIAEFQGEPVCLVDGGAYQVGYRKFYCIDDLVEYARGVLKTY